MIHNFGCQFCCYESQSITTWRSCHDISQVDFGRLDIETRHANPIKTFGFWTDSCSWKCIQIKQRYQSFLDYFGPVTETELRLPHLRLQLKEKHLYRHNFKQIPSVDHGQFNVKLVRIGSKYAWNLYSIHNANVNFHTFSRVRLSWQWLNSAFCVNSEISPLWN